MFKRTQTMPEPVEKNHAAVSDKPLHFVGFRLGQQGYALPLERVESALRMVAITPLPEAPDRDFL